MMAGAPTRRGSGAAAAYIGSVWLLALLLGALSVALHGPPVRLWELSLLTGLAVLVWRLSRNEVEDRVDFAASNIVILAAVALVEPLGAGVVGCTMAALQRGPLSVRGRLFNMAMSATVAMCGGLSYAALGGSHDFEGLRGGPLLLEVGVPLAASAVVLALVNAVLLAGIMRITTGVPVRLQVARLLSGTGLAYLANGLLAFLLVVLWVPAGLGWTSLLVVLALLLGARWAYIQYGEERRAHERTLDVLVAAIETRAPRLTGHSARVSALSVHIAEGLGLGPHQVSDIRRAALLHDLGMVALSTAVLDAPTTPGNRAQYATYPERGAALLSGLSFLSGALDAVAHHRAGPQEDPEPVSVAADVVGVADAFDLLTEVADERRRRDQAEAVLLLRAAHPPHSPRVLDALESVLVRSAQVDQS